MKLEVLNNKGKSHDPQRFRTVPNELGEKLLSMPRSKFKRVAEESEKPKAARATTKGKQPSKEA